MGSPYDRLLPSGRKVPPFALPGGICASSERPEGKRSEAQRRREVRKPGGVPFLPAGLGVHRGGVPS